MPILAGARPHFDLAKHQYKERKWMAAAESCEKAVILGYRDLVVYDIWAAALGKLEDAEDGPWREKGYGLIKMMCERWPRDWRPLYRKAEHLRSLRSYKQALVAIDKSLGLVDASKRAVVEQKRTVILGDREAAQMARERQLATASQEDKVLHIERRRRQAQRSQDFTQMLPPDILLLVVDHLLPDHPSIACRLSAVKRDWRETLRARPGPWQSLTLGGRGAAEKARHFNELSKGCLMSLRLLPSFRPESEANIGKILQHNVKNIKTFEYHQYPWTLLDYLRGEMVSLRTLREGDTQAKPVTYLDRGLKAVNSNLRELVLVGGTIALSISPTKCVDLEANVAGLLVSSQDPSRSSPVYSALCSTLSPLFQSQFHANPIGRNIPLTPLLSWDAAALVDLWEGKSAVERGLLRKTAERAAGLNMTAVKSGRGPAVRRQKEREGDRREWRNFEYEADIRTITQEPEPSNPEWSSQGRDPGNYSPELSNPMDWAQHFENIDQCYSKVETVTLRRCLIHSSRDPLALLTRTMPNLRSLILDQSKWEYHECEGQEGRSTAVVLEKLERLEITRNTRIDDDSFDTVRAPNLRHLDLWEKRVPFPAFVRLPAWAAALPRLESLDIGGANGASAASQDDILELLKTLPKLRFLNVSFRNLDDEFLKALTVGLTDEPLVPDLVALSMAGLSITSIALRDFALSRIRSTPVVSDVGTQPRRSVFAPSSANATAAFTGPSKAVIQAPRPSAVAQIRWLCLDCNELLDPALPQYLARKIPYVSWRLNRNPGSQDENDRFRGKGRYSWDREYYDTCNEVEGQKCALVPIPGKRDSYQVRHTCGTSNKDEAPPDAVNIWESQWAPSSSQDGDAQSVKRSTPSSQSASRGNAKRSKAKGRIEIGPDGSLTGF